LVRRKRFDPEKARSSVSTIIPLFSQIKNSLFLPASQQRPEKRA
jgi:hypothetical protein